jgi:hypothetical protein
LQLRYNHDNDINSGSAGYLTLWASEPGISYPYTGIGANINIGGQYYGRQGTGQTYGVYIRWDTASGQTQFWNTTGTPGTIGGQGTMRAYIASDGEIYATSSSYKVWHTGNDGSGSGLDADTVDGINPSTSLSASTIAVRDSSSALYSYYGKTNTSTDWNSAFTTTPVNCYQFHGDISAGGPTGTWWFYESMRHSNSGNYWGTQIAWGWEDNANQLYQRNVTGNSWSGWVKYWNSGNDGSGSGLDADLLDGNDSSAFARTNATNEVTNIWYFRSNRNTSSDSPPLQAYSGDGGGAIMSFHRGGYYAVNMGLDSDNVFRIGGWSAAQNRLQLDMSSNLYLLGSVRAPIFYDQDDTGYYLDPNSTGNSALRIRGGTLHGPNPSWGAYLYVGTNGRPSSDASVCVTNGNLHIDCQNGYAMYLNYYSTNNIYSWGNFGVGSDSASYRLHVHGTIYSTSNIIAASDAKLKENVSVIENAIDKVKQIRGVTYTRNDLEDKTKRHAGVIAQEVELVLPEVVDQDNEGIKNVAYGNMIGLLIEAIKEQQKQIDELKAALSNK